MPYHAIPRQDITLSVCPHDFVGLFLPSPLCPCTVASKLSNRLDISSIFAKISLDTPANLFESEFRSSSTTAESSAGAEMDVVEAVERRFGFGFGELEGPSLDAI